MNDLVPRFTNDALISRLQALGERSAREFSFDVHARGFRDAAVLLLLWPEADDLRVVFTRRPTAMRAHAGQVSFPGGSTDLSDDDSMHTALRETHEELGVRVPRTSVIGRLDDAWSVSRRKVTPWVALLDERPTFTPAPDEVERVFDASVQELLAPGAMVERELIFGELTFIDQTYRVDGELVWGLTSDLLVELLVFLGMRTARASIEGVVAPEAGHRLREREAELQSFLRRFPESGTLDRGDAAAIRAANE